MRKVAHMSYYKPLPRPPFRVSYVLGHLVELGRHVPPMAPLRSQLHGMFMVRP